MHTFETGRFNRIAAYIVALPGVLLFLFAGIMVMKDSIFFGVVFLSMATVALHVLLSIATTKVTIDSSSLTHSSYIGTKIIMIGDINVLSWGGARGTLILSVRYGKKFILISSNSFGRDALKEMERLILAARGLEGRQRWPPHAQYINLDEMAKRVT